MEDETFGYPLEGKGLLDHNMAGYEAFDIRPFEDYWFELYEGVIPEAEEVEEQLKRAA